MRYEYCQRRILTVDTSGETCYYGDSKKTKRRAARERSRHEAPKETEDA